MCKVFGYARISSNKQSIDRQIRNIKDIYPDAIMYQEAYTGTKIDRPEWSKLLDRVKEGDTIVFDSVSRMSRNATEGVRVYKELFDKGIELVFLKEHHIDTETYKKALKSGIGYTGTSVDCILEGINKYLQILAAEQIKLAFDQSEKEVLDLHKRTAEGIETARRQGKQIGCVKGSKLVTKKSITAKEQIKKYNKDFFRKVYDI